MPSGLFQYQHLIQVSLLWKRHLKFKYTGTTGNRISRTINHLEISDIMRIHVYMKLEPLFSNKLLCRLWLGV